MTIRISALGFALLLVAPLTGYPDRNTLDVAYNSEWPPYSIGEADTVTGILPAIVDELVARRLGVPVRHQGFPWKRAQRLVQEGIMDAFVTFPSQERLSYTESSRNAVFSLELRAFVRRGSQAEKALTAAPGIETVRDRRVCVMLGDGWSKAFYGKHGIAYASGRDTENCLRQIDHGRLEVFIHSTDAVQRQIKLAGLDESIVMLPQVYDSVPLTLMISKRSHFYGRLIGEFDRLVDELIKSGEYDRIRTSTRAGAN